MSAFYQLDDSASFSLLRCGIVQLQLVPPVESGLDSLIGPKLFDGLGELGWHLIALNLDGSRHDEVPSTLIGRADREFHDGYTFE